MIEAEVDGVEDQTECALFIRFLIEGPRIFGVVTNKRHSVLLKERLYLFSCCVRL